MHLTRKLMNKKPPVIAGWLLKKLSFYNDRYAIYDDFLEEYSGFCNKKGKLFAWLWFWGHTAAAAFEYFGFTLYRGRIILKNYLKVAERNIKRNKVFSIINISGLSISMACCFLILLWVNDELNYDTFNKNYNNIYRVIDKRIYTTHISHVAVTSPPLASFLKAEYPGILKSTRILDLKNFGKVLIRNGEKSFYEDNVLVADPSFLDIFAYNLVRGDPSTVLSDPGSVVITEKMAKKYFNDEDPVGKILNFADGMINGGLTVSGILEEVPHNSHLKFDFLVPFQPRERRDNWQSNYVLTYVLLDDHTDQDLLSRQISGVKKEKSGAEFSNLYLQPLERIHLYSDINWDIKGHGDIKYVYLFTILSVFILLVGSINFMNLSTARSTVRKKEIGVRKMIGARKLDLVFQFYTETLLTVLISFGITVLLLVVFLPVFNNVSGKQLSINLSGDLTWLYILCSIIGFTGILSGSYPAVFLSSLKPARVLKGKMLSSDNARSDIRRILVIVQFAITIITIISTFVISDQISFIENKNLGYHKDNIIYLKAGNELKQSFDVFKNDLQKLSGILYVTAINSLLDKRGSGSTAANWDGKDPELRIQVIGRSVEYDFIKAFKMEIIEGRDFSKEFTTDTAAYIINESAANIMTQDSPLGKWISWPTGDKGKVIGVVRDFHFTSLHDAIEPIVIGIADDDSRSNICIKINENNIADTIKLIEEKWKVYSPGTPFEYQFLDNNITSLYSSEERIGTLFQYLTTLTLFITYMGLFGLVSFVTEQRTKEIGIRKALGASVREIVQHLTKEFIILVTFSNFLAWPLAYLIMSKWLEKFAYRIEIGPGIFIISASTALLIAFITISYQTIKAAVANPVESLRYE